MGFDEKYGQITLELKPDAPEDEPFFVLRGQDELAHKAVRLYASLYLNATSNMEGCKRIMKQADAMKKWPVKKLPD